MKIQTSLIVPVYQRKDNLHLLFASIDKLREAAKFNFEVIICDDGGSDDTLELVQQYQHICPIRYIWHPHDCFQAGFARNEGAAIAKGSSLLFLDSDVLLNPSALAHYENLSLANPDAVILGRYDWLPPMKVTPKAVYEKWERLIECSLTPDKELAKTQVGIVGTDPRALRMPSAFKEPAIPCEFFASMMYSGNMLIPKHVFEAIDGFDEDLTGHGGEDCELSIRLQLAGYRAIFSDLVIGYHVCHARNQLRNAQEVNNNVAYIARKHDLDEVYLHVVEKQGTLMILPKGDS